MCYALKVIGILTLMRKRGKDRGGILRILTLVRTLRGIDGIIGSSLRSSRKFHLQANELRLILALPAAEVPLSARGEMLAGPDDCTGRDTKSSNNVTGVRPKEELDDSS